MSISMVTTFGAAMAGAVVGAFARSPVVALLALVVGVVGVLMLAFVGRLAVSRTLARMYSPERSMRDLAPPLAPDVETRLEQVNASNVVIFEGDDPFVAWGRRLREGWTISLDATKPAADVNGNDLVVTPFTPADLHKALTLAVRGFGVPDIEVRNRLFVDGWSVGTVPGLLPDPMNRPASSIPPKFVKIGIDRPRPDVRTYLCIEKISWGGEIVANLFIRAAMVANNLAGAENPVHAGQAAC
jgi:hypothetical protein